MKGIIKPLVQAELTCNQEDPEDNDELCDLTKEDIDELYNIIGEDLVFAPDEVKQTCKVAGACR